MLNLTSKVKFAFSFLRWRQKKSIRYYLIIKKPCKLATNLSKEFLNLSLSLQTYFQRKFICSVNFLKVLANLCVTCSSDRVDRKILHNLIIFVLIIKYQIINRYAHVRYKI